MFLSVTAGALRQTEQVQCDSIYILREREVIRQADTADILQCSKMTKHLDPGSTGVKPGLKLILTV